MAKRKKVFRVVAQQVFTWETMISATTPEAASVLARKYEVAGLPWHCQDQTFRVSAVVPADEAEQEEYEESLVS